jgi:putative hydrolase of the HAD superfamily
MQPRAVLFDLDDTLFDHTHATAAALAALHAEEQGFSAWTVEVLAERHSLVLEAMHAEVVAGRLDVTDARRERFRTLLLEAIGWSPGSSQSSPGSSQWSPGSSDPGLDIDTRAANLARRYRLAYESAWQPVPGAPALLAELRARGLRIGIVTNNLVVEQRAKLDCCGLADMVDALVTSEETGVAKPDPLIFVQALDRLDTRPDRAVMVGDAWATDILGARAAGVRAVWLNRRGQPRPDDDIVELKALEPTAEALRALLP